MGIGGAELIEGFSGPYEAERWIRDRAHAHAVAKGAPAGT
jgi:hypothetical protein